jgi:hypothetical protein
LFDHEQSNKALLQQKRFHRVTNYIRPKSICKQQEETKNCDTLRIKSFAIVKPFCPKDTKSRTISSLMASSVIFAWHFAICVGLKNKGKGLQLYKTKRIQYLNHDHQRRNTNEAQSTNIRKTYDRFVRDCK